jgi:hypothetical protein
VRSKSSARLYLPLAALILALLCPHAQANPGCPMNMINVYARNTIDIFVNTTDAARDTSISGAFSSRSVGGYNLATGGVRGSIWSYGNIIVNVADQYTITGVPNGTPITLQALLRVQAVIGVSPGFDANASFNVGLGRSSPNEIMLGKSVYARFPPYSIGVDSTLVLSMNVTAGQPFDLHIELTAETRWGGSFSADISAYPGLSLTFSGLPQGTTLTSCQGYRVETPIPSIPTTWSTIKAAGGK